MPVPAVIATAASEYSFNNGFLDKMVSDLAPEDWLRRPQDSSNHVAWIVGHMVWARKQLLRRLGTDWSAPWLGLFARGEKLDSSAAYPSSDALLAAWRDVGAVLANTLENVSEESLAKPAAQPGPPSADGKESGVVSFLAWHETYHLGQISCLRGWLGHKGIMG
jgi:uncharacterized damage-inducible protein DinB